MKFNNYETQNFYDEMFDSNLKPRPSYQLLGEWIEKLGPEELMHRQHSAERALLAMGITFNVYKEGNTEHIFPLTSFRELLMPGSGIRLKEDCSKGFML